MLRTRINEIDEDSIAGLLREVGFLCSMDFMQQPRMALADFLDHCFNQCGLKQSAKTAPTEGVLNTKLQDLRETPLGQFLREYCALRGVVFEAYESRKIHHILTACAPKLVSRRGKVPAVTRGERILNTIKQRRANGDL